MTPKMVQYSNTRLRERTLRMRRIQIVERGRQIVMVVLMLIMVMVGQGRGGGRKRRRSQMSTLTQMVVGVAKIQFSDRA